MGHDGWPDAGSGLDFSGATKLVRGNLELEHEMRECVASWP